MSDTYSRITADLLEDGTVLRIVLNRPKGNVLDVAMMGEIDRALAAHRNLPHLRLVFFSGAGGHFSFGASVEEHRREQAPALLNTFHELARALAAYPAPVAALVEGRCLGGAFEMVLCCHLVFAARSAIFACPEIKLGVFPPVLAAIGSARLGGALAERLLLTGADLDADAARAAGLVTAVFDGAGPALEEALLGWYRTTLRPLSSVALRHAVKAMRHGSGLGTLLDRELRDVERQYVDELMNTIDANEGIDAFVNRRPPQWSDR